MTAEHRKPLVAFFLVFAAACLIMGNGMRTQVVEVLIKAGAPPELIIAVSPDMVLGESLSQRTDVPGGAGGARHGQGSGPGRQGRRRRPRGTRHPSSPPSSPLWSPPTLSSSPRVPGPPRRRLRPRRLRTVARGQPNDRARADRGPARATPAARPAARTVGRPAPQPAPRPQPDPVRCRCRGPLSKPAPIPASRPAPKPAPAKGPGKAAPATDHGGKPGPGPRRVASRHDHDRDHALNRQTRGPERRATGRSASRHAAPARSDRDQHSNRVAGTGVAATTAATRPGPRTTPGATTRTARLIAGPSADPVVGDTTTGAARGRPRAVRPPPLSTPHSLPARRSSPATCGSPLRRRLPEHCVHPDLGVLGSRRGRAHP